MRRAFCKCHKSKVLAPSPQNGLSTRTQRVGIFNFGTDRFRVLVKTLGSGSGIRYICKKIINRVFSGIGNLDRVHPNVVQFLYERFFNVTRRAYDGVDDDD